MSVPILFFRIRLIVFFLQYHIDDARICANRRRSVCKAFLPSRQLLVLSETKGRAIIATSPLFSACCGMIPLIVRSDFYTKPFALHN